MFSVSAIFYSFVVTEISAEQTLNKGILWNDKGVNMPSFIWSRTQTILTSFRNPIAYLTDSIFARRLNESHFEYSTLVIPKVSGDYLIYSPRRLYRFAFICDDEHDLSARLEWSSLKVRIAIECEFAHSVLTDISKAMRSKNIDKTCNETNAHQRNGVFIEGENTAPNGEIRLRIGSENVKKLQKSTVVAVTYALFFIASG